MDKIQPIRMLITEFEQPIRSRENFEILRAQSLSELLLVAIQQENPKERI